MTLPVLPRQRWCSNRLAEDEHGEFVPADAPEAYRVCALGQVIAKVPQEGRLRQIRMLEAAARLMAGHGVGPHKPDLGVSGINDMGYAYYIRLRTLANDIESSQWKEITIDYLIDKLEASTGIGTEFMMAWRRVSELIARDPAAQIDLVAALREIEAIDRRNAIPTNEEWLATIQKLKLAQ